MTAVGPSQTYHTEAGRLMRLASYASLAVALLLIVSKLWAYLQTDSVALLSSIVDSLLDLAASFVNMMAIRVATAPPDHDHRFGHGKAEALAGLGQAAFITGSAVFLAVESISRFVRPVEIVNAESGIAVSALAILVTIALVLFQRSVVAKTGSLAVSADSLHYVSDVALNGAVILALVLSQYAGLPAVDPIAGLMIALWVAYSAFKIARGAWDQLMDREVDDDRRKQIKDIAMSHPDVKAMHEFRTRVSGTRLFIQLHLEMDPDMRLVDAHRVADEVELKVMEAFPGAEVLIHQDPYGMEAPPLLRD